MTSESISNRNFFLKNQWASLKQAIAAQNKDEAIKSVAYLILFSEKNIKLDLENVATGFMKVFQLDEQLTKQKKEIEALKARVPQEKAKGSLLGKVIEDYTKTMESRYERTAVSLDENTIDLCSRLKSIEENPLFEQAKALAVPNVEQRLKCAEMQPPLPRLKQPIVD